MSKEEFMKRMLINEFHKKVKKEKQKDKEIRKYICEKRFERGKYKKRYI